MRVVAQWREGGNGRMTGRLGGLVRNFKQGLEGQGVAGVQQWKGIVAAMDTNTRQALAVYGI